jgi:UDP-glucose 4-epimerase
MTQVLVTGCAGFIGSHLAEGLLNDGIGVVGVDCFNANYGRSEKLRNLEKARQWDAFDFVPVDLSRGDLVELVADCDAVFHLAAEPGVRESWGSRFEAYVRNNVVATQVLLDALRQSPQKRLVYASSSSIYGNAERLPTPESAVPQPLSPYGATKLAAEHLCHLYNANFGLEVVSLRYFSVYGPRQRPDMAFSRFCRAAIDREPIDIFGDGTQTRDFTYVADVVAATRAAADTPSANGEIMNIGGGSQSSVNETLTIISELADHELEVRYHPHSTGDAKDTSADTAAAQRILGYAPSTTLAEGIAHEFEWARSVTASRAAG